MQLQSVLQTIERDRTPSYLAAPYPCRLDEQLATLILIHRLSDEPSRVALRRSLGPQHAQRLLRYAERLLVLSLRKRDPALLFEAAMALVLEDLDADVRKTVALLDDLTRACAELAVDKTELLERAARFASPRAAELLEAFARSDR
ncbi:MAG TPA: hypothetical protein VFF06_17170 [Polyangia bacterium]|nr:hypothetical protein [Polyangia bacterium]